ncbi:MAG: TRAP transporter small permease subunit [Thermoplasmatales archaeon]|nr:TRAP transporter small permease subunit [Thermoplasmatales archaeon]
MNTQSLKNFYQRVSRINNTIDRLLEPIIAAMMTLLLLTVSFQVLYRFVIVKFFSLPLPFSEELALWLLIWITYLAIGICLKEGMHAAVDIVAKKLNRRVQVGFYFFLRFLMLILIITVIIVGLDLALGAIKFKSPTLRIPMTFLYLAPVVGAVLMLFQMFVEAVGVFSQEVLPFSDNS